MRDSGARILITTIILLQIACSNNGVQSGQREDMQVYSVEFSQKILGVSRNEVAIEETSVSPGEQSGQPESQVQIKPAVLLDQTYTIQIGVFSDASSASSFVSENQLDAEESGIAIATMDGKTRFILAYGVYSSESEAQSAAKQLTYRGELEQLELIEPLKVVTLAEIKAISETVNANSDILEIGSTE